MEQPQTAQRARWQIPVLFAALILGALTLRLLTFERFLPAQDYTDEVWYYGFAQQYRNRADVVYLDMTAHTAPPAQAWISARVIDFADAVSRTPWELPSEHYYWLRLWAVIMGTATTALIAWAGWQLGGASAGLLAGFLWAFHPQIIDINSLLIADPYMFLFVAAALALAIFGWQQRSAWALLVSLLAGIGAIYSKFWVASAVFPFVAAALWLIWQQPRKMRVWIAVYALIAALSAYGLLIVVDPLGNAQGLREAATFRDDGLTNAFDAWRNRENWRFALYIVGQPIFYALMPLGALAYLDNRRRNAPAPAPLLLLMLALFCLLTTMLSSTFTVSRLDAGKIRHVLPTAIATLLLVGVAVSQIGAALRHRLRMRPRLALAAAWSVPLLVMAAHLPSMSAQNAALVRNYQQGVYINEVVWRYTDSSLPREGLVWFEEGSPLTTMWNRAWGGYNGDKPFEWWNEPSAQLAEQTPAQLIARNITHLIFSDKDYQRMREQAPEIEPLVNEMLRLKTIPAPQDVFLWHTDALENLNEVYVYRILPPQNPLEVSFGESVRLVGYDLSNTTPQAGETLTLRLYWQAPSRPTADYSLFVHVYDAEGALIAQADQPPVSAARPTSTWDDATETLLSEQIALVLPSDLQAGELVLAVGLYGYADGVRLPTTHPDGYHPLPLTVR